MKSHTFSNKNIKASKAIFNDLSSFTIEKRYSKYNNPKNFNKVIISSKITTEIENDINRSPNLFIQNQNSPLVNIVDNLRDLLQQNTLSTRDLSQYLQNKYELSLSQANYVVMSSTQSSIGGGYILSASLINNNNIDPTHLIYRPELMSKIIIDEERNVKYIGGQIMLFDCSTLDYSEAVNEKIGFENYLALGSHDKLTVYITAILGKLGEKFIKVPQVIFDVSGEGKIAEKIVQQFQTVKTQYKAGDGLEIFNDYIEFSEEIYIVTGKMSARYEYLENPLHKKMIKPFYEVELNGNTEDLESIITNEYSNDNIVNSDNPKNSDNCSNISLAPIKNNNQLDNPDILLSDDFAALREGRAESKSRKALGNNAGKFISEEESWNLVDTLNDLMQVVSNIINWTTTNNDILSLQDIFILYPNKIESFIRAVNKILNNQQLHMLNNSIMKAMNVLLPVEDKQCLLRLSEHQIFHKLLLLEAKRNGLIIKIPDNIDDNLVLPEIPKEIWDHYLTLENIFYNQPLRNSDKTLAELKAESIHWLFINPLILENTKVQTNLQLAKKLLQFPGEYTKLLAEYATVNNINDPTADAIKTHCSLPKQQANKLKGEILQIFIIDLSNWLVQEILEKSTISIKKLKADKINDQILDHLLMNANVQNLFNKATFLILEISDYLKKLYNKNENSKHELLTKFLYTVISFASLQEKIESKNDVLKPDKALEDYNISSSLQELTISSPSSQNIILDQQAINTNILAEDQISLNRGKSSPEKIARSSLKRKRSIVEEDEQLGKKTVKHEIDKYKEEENFVPLSDINNYPDLIKHLKKYYTNFLSKKLLDNLINSYSNLGEEGISRIIEGVQDCIIQLGDVKIIDWMIQDEGFDPIIILDDAIYHYIRSEKIAQFSVIPIIEYIVTHESDITLPNIQKLYNDLRNDNYLEIIHPHNIQKILTYLNSVVNAWQFEDKFSLGDLKFDYKTEFSKLDNLTQKIYLQMVTNSLSNNRESTYQELIPLCQQNNDHILYDIHYNTIDETSIKVLGE